MYCVPYNPTMADADGSFIVSEQSLDSLRQLAATVGELSASVASINQSIERFVPPPPRMCVTLTPALSVTRVSPSVKNLAKTFGSTAASHAHE